MTTDPAVTAAAEALWTASNNAGCTWHGRRYVDFCDDCVGAKENTTLDAQTAVAAARPVIEAEVRARIAADIEAHGCFDLLDGLSCDCTDGAARIAKGDTA